MNDEEQDARLPLFLPFVRVDRSINNDSYAQRFLASKFLAANSFVREKRLG